MANEYAKKSPTSSAEREKKTTLKFHLTSVRMTIIKKTNNNKCWRRCRGKETLYTIGGNINYSSMEIRMEVPQETKNNYHVILLHHSWATFPKGYKSMYKRDTYISIFIEALFTIAKVWFQLRCPSKTAYI
jgi:hypothetical protein